MLLTLWKPPPAPSDYPSGLPGPVWCFPPGIVAPGDGLVALPLCLGCRSAWFPLFVCLVATKACGPVWGFVPIHLSMIQDPLWDSVKALEHPLWYLCAFSPPVLCCLPAPLLSLLCGVSPVCV